MVKVRNALAESRRTPLCLRLLIKTRPKFAEATIMTTKKRPPVPLETLKQQSSLGAAKANEYSIKSWLVAAKDSFERSAAAWRDGQKPSGDPARVEEAYVLQRRGAE